MSKHRFGLSTMKVIVALSGAALLAACTSATPYQPASTASSDGYTTQKIEANRFRVSFKGNSATSRQAVDSYVLYRCAEVTLKNGDDYFVVVNKDVDKNTRYETYGNDLAWGWHGGWRWRHSIIVATEPSYLRPISSYDAIADIVTYQGTKPAANADAYDAHEVLAAVGPAVVGPAPAPVAAIEGTHTGRPKA